MNNQFFYVYILKCSDGTYYTGMSTNLEQRLSDHQAGVDSRAYTYQRQPVTLVWADHFPTRVEALDAEHQIKGWSKAKKEALISGDYLKIHEIVTAERRKREKKTNIITE